MAVIKDRLFGNKNRKVENIKASPALPLRGVYNDPLPLLVARRTSTNQDCTEKRCDEDIEEVAIRWPLKVSTMTDREYRETANHSDGAYIPRGRSCFWTDGYEEEAASQKLQKTADVLYIPPVEYIKPISTVMQGEDVGGVDLLFARGVYVGFTSREYAGDEPKRKEPVRNVGDMPLPDVSENEKNTLSETVLHDKEEHGAGTEDFCESLFEPEEMPRHKDMADAQEENVDRKSLISVFKKNFKNRKK